MAKSDVQKKQVPDPNEDDRRASTGPSFRLRGRVTPSAGALGGMPSETELAPTPGESTASDGSGYAGIVGRMDMDSLETRSPFGTGNRLGPSSVTERNTGPAVDYDNLERRHTEASYEGDSEVATTQREKVSRYTSVLRRDGTSSRASASANSTAQAPATSTSTSSGSTPSNDPASSRPRRPAMGWHGSPPP